MYQYILDHLPNKSSFRFVDNISSLDENGITGLPRRQLVSEKRSEDLDL